MFLGDLNHYVRNLATFLERPCGNEATRREGEGERKRGRERGRGGERERGSEVTWRQKPSHPNPSILAEPSSYLLAESNCVSDHQQDEQKN